MLEPEKWRLDLGMKGDEDCNKVSAEKGQDSDRLEYAKEFHSSSEDEKENGTCFLLTARTLQCDIETLILF